MRVKFIQSFALNFAAVSTVAVYSSQNISCRCCYSDVPTKLPPRSHLKPKREKGRKGGRTEQKRESESLVKGREQQWRLEKGGGHGK